MRPTNDDDDPVIEQTKTVSSKGPKPATKPSCKGSLVSDCPWYMGAFPPRFHWRKPLYESLKRPKPQNPPVKAVLKLNASVNIEAKAGTMAEKLVIRINTPILK